ncbi:MAG: hypothetical protein IPP83_19740 [Flavobacteriales bacterium]|nr:hypothetical protein [Flavobacteriales bacterium]
MITATGRMVVRHRFARPRERGQTAAEVVRANTLRGSNDLRSSALVRHRMAGTYALRAPSLRSDARTGLMITATGRMVVRHRFARPRERGQTAAEVVRANTLRGSNDLRSSALVRHRMAGTYALRAPSLRSDARTGLMITATGRMVVRHRFARPRERGQTAAEVVRANTLRGSNDLRSSALVRHRMAGTYALRAPSLRCDARTGLVITATGRWVVHHRFARPRERGQTAAEVVRANTLRGSRLTLVGIGETPDGWGLRLPSGRRPASGVTRVRGW